MPDVQMMGTTFVLTGSMWVDRDIIIARIRLAGGVWSPRVTSGCALVIASSSLQHDDHGKWTTRPGKATVKIREAIKLGVSVLHERELRRALEGVTQLTDRTTPTLAPARIEWTDELRASMDETSKLLSSF